MVTTRYIRTLPNHGAAKHVQQEWAQPIRYVLLGIIDIDGRSSRAGAQQTDISSTLSRLQELSKAVDMTRGFFLPSCMGMYVQLPIAGMGSRGLPTAELQVYWYNHLRLV